MAKNRSIFFPFLPSSRLSLLFFSFLWQKWPLFTHGTILGSRSMLDLFVLVSLHTQDLNWSSSLTPHRLFSACNVPKSSFTYCLLNLLLLPLLQLRLRLQLLHTYLPSVSTFPLSCADTSILRVLQLQPINFDKFSDSASDNTEITLLSSLQILGFGGQTL